jgi:hypothetical protein
MKRLRVWVGIIEMRTLLKKHSAELRERSGERAVLTPRLHKSV